MKTYSTSTKTATLMRLSTKSSVKSTTTTKTVTNSKKRKQNSSEINNNNDENEKENQRFGTLLDLNYFFKKTKLDQNQHKDLTSTINLNRIKRLRLNSISPNTTNKSSSTTKPSPLTTNNTFLFAAAHKYEHLMTNTFSYNSDENSSSSMDSGIGFATNVASPASFEIQLINATAAVASNSKTGPTFQLDKDRPRLKKENYLQSVDDFSSQSSSSISTDSDDEDDVDDDDFKLIKNNEEEENSRLFFENTIEIANEEEVNFDLKFNLSSRTTSTKKSHLALNTSHETSSTSLNARRCLFKNSPITPSLTKPTILNQDTTIDLTKNLTTNNSTPKIQPMGDCTNFLLNDTAKSSKNLYRQITPISTFRYNPIITNDKDDEYDINEQHNDSVTELTKQNLKASKTVITNLMDYSLNSIENSLEMFAKKRRETASTYESSSATKKSNILNRINECDDDNDEDNECKYNHELIKTSLDIESNSLSRRLIGDHSRYHTLPCIASIKHADLNVIEANTLTQVLDGRYASQIDRVIVIDSRYPYEYEGGHIRTAQNVYTKEKLLEVFLSDEAKLNNSIMGANTMSRTIIIFHCEFSSERGPNLLRFLRNQDRAANSNAYPKLFYPEIYLLEGGYKAFYETHEDYCEPKMYKPMLHADHAQDLKHFRAKTKTWETQHKHNNAITTATGYKTSLHHHHHHASSRTKTSEFKSNVTRKNNLGRLQRFPKSTLF